MLINALGNFNIKITMAIYISMLISVFVLIYKNILSVAMNEFALSFS